MSCRTTQIDSEDGTSLRTMTAASHRPGLLVPPPSTWLGSVRTAWQQNKGPGLVVLAQLFASLMNAATRMLETESGRMQTFQLLLARMGITFVLCSAYMWWTKTDGFPFGDHKIRRLLHVRGIAGFVSVFGLYYSLQYLPLAEATVLTFLAPTVSCWACALLIHEPFTRREQIAGLVSLVGVALIARPVSWLPHGLTVTRAARQVPDDLLLPNAVQSGEVAMNEITQSQRLTAVGIGLLGVMGAAVTYTTIRWIGKRAPAVLSVNYFAAWTTLISAVVLQLHPGIDFQLPSNLREWGLLLFIGVSGFVMQILFTAGLQQERNSRATNMVYTQMLFAVLFDKLVWNSTLSMWSLVGSSIILTCAIYVAMQDSSRMSKKENMEGQTDESEQLLWLDESRSADSTLVEDGYRTSEDEEQCQMIRT